MEFKILIISILLSTLVAPLIQLIFLKYKIFDPINQRSSHSVLATRTGGLACFSVFFLISIYFYLFEYEVYDFSLLIPLSIMFIIGVYDDLGQLGKLLQIFIESTTARSGEYDATLGSYFSEDGVYEVFII